MNQTRVKPKVRISGIVLNLLGWGGSLFFLALIWKQVQVVNWTAQSMATINWPYATLAFLLLLIGLGLQSQLAWITQQRLHYNVDHYTIYRVWFFSQVAKYIPGSLWQVAARSIFYVRRGVPLGTASASTLWELVATLVGSLLICLFSFILNIESTLAQLSALVALLLVILAISFYLTWPWQLLLTLRIGLARRMLDALAQLGTTRHRMIIELMALSAIVWLIIGVGFYYLAVAFGASHGLSWWQAAISFNVAYSIGFLVVIAPTGLGVREVVLAFLLAAYFDPPTLAVFVLAARLWWILGDGVHISVAGVYQLATRKARGQALLESSNEVAK